MDGLFSFVVLALVALVVANALSRRFSDRAIGKFLLLGTAMRIVGSTARLEVMQRAYDAVGDSKVYFDYARMAVSSIWSGDFDFMFATDAAGRWYGTHFIEVVTSFVIFLVGDSMRAGFLFFSLLSFAGLCLCVSAFEEAFGTERATVYSSRLWLLPSLWFWPSSIGKDALMILAVSLVAFGYVGKKGIPRWGALAAGVVLAAAIRPHVASLIALSAVLGEFIRGQGKTTRLRRLLTVFVAGLMMLLCVRFGLSQLGLGDADLEGIEEHFEFRADRTEKGGSRIDRVSGVLGVPLALVNVLFRPFPWENLGIAMFSSAELWIFWFLVFRRRKELRQGLVRWRENRLLVFAVPFTLALALIYGMAFANLGIIARQRVVVLPFLLQLLVIGAKVPTTAAAPPARPRRTVHRASLARLGESG